MSLIPWLEETNFIFPDVNTALTDPDGLLAASERLDPALVLEAYKHSIFPWYSDDQPVLWWSPNPRCVLYPRKFHVSRSFKRVINNNPFEVRKNTAFREVMLACGEPRTIKSKDENEDKDEDNNSIDETGTWITDAMLDVYCRLHQSGHAHSIECWQDNQLVGGMYGLIIGDIFFGESMFSKVENASKVAIHYLSQTIKPYLIDAQVHSAHLESLGAETIDREVFIKIISTRENYSLNI